MAKKPKQYRHSPLQEAQQDLHGFVAGNKLRRQKRVRFGVSVLLISTLMLASMAVGFTVMEALLQVSETPLQDEVQTTTAPPETTAPLEPLPEPTWDPIRSFYVPIRMLDSRDQSQQLQAQARNLDTNTAVMTFKDSNGWLSYRSNLMQMNLVGANALARFRTDWTKFDLMFRAQQQVIAVIHCFDDPLAAQRMEGAAVMTAGGDVWEDAQGRAWLNPWSQAAQEYLLAVIREVAAFGQYGERVDFIMLRGVAFPDGDLSSAVFPGGADHNDPDERNAVLRDFIEQAQVAAGGAQLIVMVPRAGAEHDDAIGGDFWGSAADFIAVDVRDTAGELHETFWRTRPVLPVVASTQDGADMRDFIVLTDEAQ